MAEPLEITDLEAETYRLTLENHRLRNENMGLKSMHKTSLPADVALIHALRLKVENLDKLYKHCLKHHGGFYAR